MLNKYGYVLALSALVILGAGQDLRAMAGAGAGAGSSAGGAGLLASTTDPKISEFNRRAIFCLGDGDETSLKPGQALVGFDFMGDMVSVECFLNLKLCDLVRAVKRSLGLKASYTLDLAVPSGAKKINVSDQSSVQDLILALYCYRGFGLAEDDGERNELLAAEDRYKSVMRPKRRLIDLVLPEEYGRRAQRAGLSGGSLVVKPLPLEE